MKINMDCKQIRQILASDYLDNELDLTSRNQVDRHLEKCPACRKISEHLTAITLPLRRAQKQKVPPGVWSRIQTELRRQKTHAARPRTAFQTTLLEVFLMRPAFAAVAAAVILILISAAFYMQTPRPAGTSAGVTSVPDLSSLTGDIEIREQNTGFDSGIEQLLL